MNRTLKLKDVCKINSGYAFKSSNFSSKGIPIIKIGNISNNKVNINSNTVYIDENVEKYKQFVVRKGDILIALSGATTGKFGLYSGNEEVLLNQRLAKISPKNYICGRYLYHYMKKLQNVILNKALGCAQPNISIKEIEEISIFIPNIDKQNKIVSTLDKAQSLIDKRKAQIQALDELIKSVFYDMFGDPVSNTKEWEQKTLSNLGELSRGKSKHRPRNAPELLNGPYPLIQTGDIANSGLYLKKYTQTYSELGLKQSKMWPKGTLCITIAANIAKTSILTFDACFPDSVVAFIPSKQTNNMFIQLWISFLQKILEESAPESAQKNINLKILKEQMVIVPPIDLQNRFATIVKNIEKQKDKLNASLTKLEDNFNCLMQRAFKGELFN